MYDAIGLYDMLLPELVRSQAWRCEYERSLSVEELTRYVDNGVRTNTNAQDDLRFILKRVAEIFDLERCTSEFCTPGSDQVRRCEGRAGHEDTVMHAGDGAVWGDNAGIDNHPAEHIMIKLSRVRNQLRHALATAYVLRDQGEELIEILDERDDEITWLNACLDVAVRTTGSDFRATTSRVTKEDVKKESTGD